jgi:hypothetical protein
MLPERRAPLTAVLDPMGWTLIDNVSVLKLALSPVHTLKNFTKNQYSMIARVLVEVREYTDQA